MFQKKRAGSQPQMESQTHDERTATPCHCDATADMPYPEADCHCHAHAGRAPKNEAQHALQRSHQLLSEEVDGSRSALAAETNRCEKRRCIANANEPVMSKARRRKASSATWLNLSIGEASK